MSASAKENCVTNIEIVFIVCYELWKTEMYINFIMVHSALHIACIARSKGVTQEHMKFNKQAIINSWFFDWCLIEVQFFCILIIFLFIYFNWKITFSSLFTYFWYFSSYFGQYIKNYFTFPSVVGTIDSLNKWNWWRWNHQFDRN